MNYWSMNGLPRNVELLLGRVMTPSDFDQYVLDAELEIGDSSTAMDEYLAYLRGEIFFACWWWWGMALSKGDRCECGDPLIRYAGGRVLCFECDYGFASELRERQSRREETAR